MAAPVESPIQLPVMAARQAGDAPAIAALRAAGAETSAAMAWPSSQAERPWKYLDVSRLDLSGYRAASVGALEILDAENEGVVLASTFAAAEGATAAIVARHLGSLVPPSYNRFAALHYALLADGAVVHVPANAEGVAVRLVRSYEGTGQVAAPHTLIVTGANSRVSVIEDYRSGEGDLVVLPVVEIVPGPGSEVRYTALHRWGTATRVFAAQRTVTERDSALVSLALVTGGLVVKGHIESTLSGPGSSSELYGLFAGAGKEHIDFYTLQDHIGPDTRSDLLYKAALRDESRAAYYGLTRVGLGAKNADANQVSRNLLLSRHAKADSDPVLEILTNNVIRASHGATAGPVDQDQLFYIQARGIPRAAAEAMLVRGFLAQVLDRVPSESLREELAAALDVRLGTAP